MIFGDPEVVHATAELPAGRHHRRERPVGIELPSTVPDVTRPPTVVSARGHHDVDAQTLMQGTSEQRVSIPLQEERPHDEISDAGSPVLESGSQVEDAGGVQVCVHAIGDRDNGGLLEVYAAVASLNGRRDRRFRIEHAQHLTREAMGRFGAQGVIPAMQPYHAIDDGRWAEKRIGPERIRTTYAFRSLLERDARLSFGSDWTVAPLNPLEGIYAAVTRRTIDGRNPGGWVPEEKITVEEALRCYTVNNAYAGFFERQSGTLEAGKLADFVALSRDLFTIDPLEIPSVEVVLTVVGGRVMYPAQ